jgi:hypothetical protein
MAILLSCACGRRLHIQDEFAGRQGQCPACGRTLDIPAAYRTEVLGARAEPDTDGVPPGPPEPAPAETPMGLREVENHGGGRLPPDVDFFAPPPPEIGPVVSAKSSLCTSTHPCPPASRAGLALVCGGFALVLVVLLVVAAQPHSPAPYVLLPLPAGLAASGLALLATRFKHTCSYVGRDGVARFRCSGDRDHLTLRAVFLFRDAAELRTSQVLHYVNGAYTGTHYTFTWTDVTGHVRYVWRGRYHSKEGTPKPDDPFYFGRAAEVAWTSYLLPGAFRQLELSGAVLFLVGGGNWARVTPTSLILHFGGQQEEWDRQDIAGVAIDGGVIKIRRHGAKEGWFSSGGVFKFDFTALGNAQLFFFLVEKVLGVPVG